MIRAGARSLSEVMAELGVRFYSTSCERSSVSVACDWFVRLDSNPRSARRISS